MEWMTFLYLATGLMFGFAFVPQIVLLSQDSPSPYQMNLPMVVIFTYGSAVSLGYALLVNGDPYFIFCSGVSTIGNAVMLVLGMAHRRRLARQKPQHVYSNR